MKLNEIIRSQYNGLSIPTLEGIDYQYNDPFGSRLEEIFTEYKELVDSGVSQKVISSQKQLKAKLEKLIHDRLGLKVVLITDQYLAAVIPNLYTENSAVVRDAVRDIKAITNEEVTGAKALSSKVSGDKLGTVDNKRAKISGWFSEQELPLYLNFHQLFTDLNISIPELVAICLHELGHAYDGIAYAYTINQANLIILDVIQGLNNGRAGDTEYVYKELYKIDECLGKDTVEGLMSGNPAVFGVSAFRMLIGATNTMSGSRTYDRTSSEATADSFAVRFGYGSQLVTGLDKLYTDPAYKFTNSFINVFVASLFTSVVVMLGLLIFGVIGAAMPLASKIAIGLVDLVALVTMREANGVSSEDKEYDGNHDRIRRIMHDMIGSLKNPELPKATKRSILVQIETVEAVLARTKNVPNLLQKAFLLAFPSDRRAQRSIAAQQKIEMILANQIFKSAAKLDVKA